jgi:hypothetical protein
MRIQLRPKKGCFISGRVALCVDASKEIRGGKRSFCFHSSFFYSSAKLFLHLQKNTSHHQEDAKKIYRENPKFWPPQEGRQGLSSSRRRAAGVEFFKKKGGRVESFKKKGGRVESFSWMQRPGQAP